MEYLCILCGCSGTPTAVTSVRPISGLSFIPVVVIEMLVLVWEASSSLIIMSMVSTPTGMGIMDSSKLIVVVVMTIPLSWLVVRGLILIRSIIVITSLVIHISWVTIRVIVILVPSTYIISTSILTRCGLTLESGRIMKIPSLVIAIVMHGRAIVPRSSSIVRLVWYLSTPLVVALPLVTFK